MSLMESATGADYCRVCDGPCAFAHAETTAGVRSGYSGLDRYADQPCPYCGGTGHISGHPDIRCFCPAGGER